MSSLEHHATTTQVQLPDFLDHGDIAVRGDSRTSQ